MRDCRIIVSTRGCGSQNRTTRNLPTHRCSDRWRRWKMPPKAKQPRRPSSGVNVPRLNESCDNQLPMAFIFTRYSILMFTWAFSLLYFQSLHLSLRFQKCLFLGAFPLYSCKQTSKTKKNISSFAWKHRRVNAAWTILYSICDKQKELWTSMTTNYMY